MINLNSIHQSILDSIQESIFVRDLDMNIIYSNSASKKVTGWETSEIKGKKCFEVFGNECFQCRELCPVDKVIQSRVELYYKNLNFRTKNGTIKNIAVTITPYYEDSEIRGAVIKITDKSYVEYIEQERIRDIMVLEKEIERRKKLEEDLKIEKFRLSEAERIAHIGNWDWNIQTHTIDWSDEIYKILELEWTEVVTPRTFFSYVVPDERETVHSLLNDALYKQKEFNITHKMQVPNKSVKHIKQQGKVYFGENGEPIRMIGIVQDVTQMHELHERLLYLSYIDEVTGVYNRRKFNEEIEREWKDAIIGNHEMSMILLDVDYFKKYNDMYGHLKGDECLYRIAQIINSSLNSDSDLLARYGGEEFVVLLPNKSKDETLSIAEKIRMNIFNEKIPHLDSDISNFVTISIGFSTLIPSPNESNDTLLRYADKALYKSKSNGRNQVHFLGRILFPS